MSCVCALVVFFKAGNTFPSYRDGHIHMVNV